MYKFKKKVLDSLHCPVKVRTTATFMTALVVVYGTMNTTNVLVYGFYSCFEECWYSKPFLFEESEREKQQKKK